jgi:hypothetical protein
MTTERQRITEAIEAYSDGRSTGVGALLYGAIKYRDSLPPDPPAEKTIIRWHIEVCQKKTHSRLLVFTYDTRAAAESAALTYGPSSWSVQVTGPHEHKVMT